MPRKAKITTDDKDRKDQRDHTEALKKVAENAEKLSTTPPKHLTGEAKKLWSKIVPALNETGYVIQVDQSEVETLVINYAMLREAYESVKKDGVIYSAGDKLFKNPAVAIIDSATKVIKSIGSDLGLSPQSRATLIDMAKSDEESDNETKGEDLAGYFGGNK
ncbi:phage terminase small subunit P27 family [Weissella coleopterorum]|uniref:Phage terminase small subunit P27 family n=1 Tax=Weissella coleopterorum TaxID=2714949 RepID=A0A6G8AY33_9LACO|nr:phage terminase small subunit P27 family [Weissella coleopterorum]QIL49865.1 phage terminase small subunit P27 family [Weissella coleopterorum]